MSGIGLNATLLMATRSLNAQRQAIEVAGHNIANANTPGAARQRVVMQSDVALQYVGVNGVQGLGAYITSIQSVRSSLLDAQVAEQNSLLGYYDQFSSLSSLLEQTLGENFTSSEIQTTPGVSSLTGIQNSLNSFFDAWNALASDPTSSVARSQVLSQANALAADVRTAYGRIVDAKAELFPAAQQDCDTVNSLASQIATLNQQISRVEIQSNQTASDLRDQRQALIEELSTYVNVTVTDNSTNDRMVDIRLTDNSSVALVSGPQGGGADDPSDPYGPSYSLSVQSSFNSSTNSSLRIVGTSDLTTTVLSASQPTLGRIGAAVAVAGQVIGDTHLSNDDTLLGRLNQFVGNLSTAVNSLHAGTSSWTPSGANGAAFFSGTAVNFAVALTAESQIATGGGSTFPGALNSDVAQSIAALRTNTSIGEYHRQTVAELGLTINQSERSATAQALVAQQITQERESVSGISVDEEMTNLLTFQHAYQASARLISILDGLLETTTNLGR